MTSRKAFLHPGKRRVGINAIAAFALLSSLLSLLISPAISAQAKTYTAQQIHSHNDYAQAIPFWNAYNNKVGSIEADVFVSEDGKDLWVAHSASELATAKRSLDQLYLQPLQQCILQNKGYVYEDSSLSFQLMIDLKTEAGKTLDALVKILLRYPAITNSRSLKIVISGSRPDPALFSSYPDFIRFDGDLFRDYDDEAMHRIAMLSAGFTAVSAWNGKGRPTESDMKRITAAISKGHKAGKPVRFWATPDNINAWYRMISLGIDYLNTDKVTALAEFLDKRPGTIVSSSVARKKYVPAFESDEKDIPPRNIILIISDGTGLAQWFAAYTALKKEMSLFTIKNIGISLTRSFDNYITDSAPGASAFSTGVHANNRAVGVDHTGRWVPVLPELLAEKKMASGVVTSGDITDATPAAFYAHCPERDSSAAIAGFLLRSPLELAIGAGNRSADPLFSDSAIAAGWQVLDRLPEATAYRVPVKSVILDRHAAQPAGVRKDWSLRAFNTAIEQLSANPRGFFLMFEGAQPDHGGHDNNLPYMIDELADLDQVVSRALEFADDNKQTLVIVTGDHETGGLTLLDGDEKTGYVAGQFSTNDHTAVPVPVFAYGPRSFLFRGVYENTEIHGKILKALAAKK